LLLIIAVFSAAMSSPEPLGFSEICLTLPSFFSLFAVDVEIYDDLSPYIVNIEYMPDGEHIINFDRGIYFTLIYIKYIYIIFFFFFIILNY